MPISIVYLFLFAFNDVVRITVRNKVTYTLKFTRKEKLT